MQVPSRLDRISLEAREIHLGRALLTLALFVLYGLGWLAGKLCRGLWLAATWTLAAIKLGWRDALKLGRP